MNHIISQKQKYNLRSRKGRKPNFRLMRNAEQSVQSERAKKGLYFTPNNALDDRNYVASEYAVHKMVKKTISKDCKYNNTFGFLHIRNNLTNEYYRQPYFVAKNEALYSNDNGTYSLSKLPRINHKKLQKMVSANPENFDIVVSDLGEFDSFMQLCNADRLSYLNDKNTKKYNRNMDYEKIFGSLYYDKQLETQKSVSVINNKEEALDIDFSRTMYVIINKTVGKIQYVPQTRFTDLETFVNNYGSVELKRTFNRGDVFEVVSYEITNKKEYSELAFDSKYARSFRRLDINKNSFDTNNVLDIYNNYKDTILSEFDNKLVSHADVMTHLNKVYNHIHSYIKDINPNKEDKKYTSLEQTILDSFSVLEFKRAWHNSLFHDIVTNQKVFLKEAGLNKVLLAFSGHSLRMTTEDQRRCNLTKASAQLDGSSSLSLLTSINKIFYGSSRRVPSNRKSVALIADAKRGSQSDNQSDSVVNSRGSYAHTKDSNLFEQVLKTSEMVSTCSSSNELLDDDYISSLVSYVDSMSSFEIDYDSQWAD